MALVAWSPAALADLKRLHGFLAEKNPRAADSALVAIRLKTQHLQNIPLAGRIHATMGGRRELIVRFSNAGYSVLYSADDDVVRIIAVRHMREDQY